MKQKDVVVGGTYLTYIGQSLARVVVVQVREQIPGYDWKKPRLLIRRENEERCLPKLRTAAALRPLPTSSHFTHHCTDYCTETAHTLRCENIARNIPLPNISADTGADLTGVVLHYEEEPYLVAHSHTEE